MTQLAVAKRPSSSSCRRRGLQAGEPAGRGKGARDGIRRAGGRGTEARGNGRREKKSMRGTGQGGGEYWCIGGGTEWRGGGRDGAHLGVAYGGGHALALHAAEARPGHDPRREHRRDRPRHHDPVRHLPPRRQRAAYACAATARGSHVAPPFAPSCAGDKQARAARVRAAGAGAMAGAMAGGRGPGCGRRESGPGYLGPGPAGHVTGTCSGGCTGRSGQSP
jgi:hypothetical protein